MMEWRAGVRSQNILLISISPTQMVSNTERYKTVKMKEIISAVCTLFNSGGGTLELQFDSATPKQHKDACIRMIDQRVVGMVGITTATSHLKFDVNPREIILHIQEASKLVSINYNLYLPCESQVVAVPTIEPTAEIKRIVQRKVVEGKSVQIGSHRKVFLKGQKTNLQEGSNVEMKSLKAVSSKRVTLADRIVGKSNKLSSYISAFANHSGGHIYYGVNHQGIVDGEEMTEKEKDEIIKKVTKTINNMVWTHDFGQPQRGKHWDIFFEPVVDANSNPIPSTFVIIISVPPCLGGVFTEEPESYYIVEGKVRKLNFRDWWTYFTETVKRTFLCDTYSDDPCQPIPFHVPRVQWSSEKNRKLCCTLSQRLVQYRNDEDMTTFKTLSQQAIEHFPDSDAQLIAEAEEVVEAFKHYNFKKAKSILGNFATHLTTSKDKHIFEVRLLLLKSMIEHSKGNCKNSKEIAQCGLQMMQQIPVDLVTVWLYIEAATVTNTILTETLDFQCSRSLKNEALQYLQLAARDANSLEDPSHRMFDLQQKLHIYKAWVLLECSVTGQVAQHNGSIRNEDIEAAAEELVSVSETVFKGSPLTHFRNIQYHLAQCDLFFRRSQIPQEDSVSNLKHAFECGSKARTRARKHRFENMVDYANKRLAYLTEKLVRHAVDSRKQQAKNFLIELEY